MTRIASTLTNLAAVSAIVTGLGTAGVLLVPQTATAGSGAAFVGGMIGGHVLTNVMSNQRAQTQAVQYQAYHQQPAAAPAQSSASSVESKLQTLDKLAAGGYISKAEYQRRRQAILDAV